MEKERRGIKRRGVGGGDKRPIEMESSEKKMIEGEPRRMERKRKKKYSRKRERKKYHIEDRF